MLRTLRRTIFILWLALLLPACKYVPLPTGDKTPTPIPVSIEELAVTSHDLPNLGVAGWDEASPFSVSDTWTDSGAMEAIAIHHNHLSNGASVIQTIVRFADSEDAAQTWRRWRNARITEDFTRFETVPLLSTEKLAGLHSDDAMVRCEDYGNGAKLCAIRMRYEQLYVEVTSDFTRGRMTPEHFYEVVMAVDKKMIPIWANNTEE